jgi:tetratricopeptide (TPR) repeat protein
MAKETIESLCQKAQQAVAQGQNERARQYYTLALAMRSDLPNVHYGLATVCYLLNDLPNAAHHFREVIRLDPLRAGAYINLGAIYNKLNQMDEAIDVLRKGIQLDMKRAEGYYNLGLVYRRKGQADLAIQAYREATRVNPRMSDAHYNLANLYFERSQLNLAVTHYEKALEVRPNWQKALVALEQAHAALEPQQDSDNSTSATVDPSNAPTERILDPERNVDPEKHGVLLKQLHRQAIDSENLSREFVHMVAMEIEPTLKELSNCLLHSSDSRIELDHCLQKVESAISHLHTTRKNLQGRVEEVRVLGNNLAQS